MDFEFVLDEYFLAFYILKRKMHNESKEIRTIKESYKKNNGYKKIIGEKLLDFTVYEENDEINHLLTELISTKEFLTVYDSYTKFDKKEIAIKVLNDMIPNNNKEMTEVKNYLWDKYRLGYKKILNLDTDDALVYLKDLDCKSLIEEFIKTEEYKKLFKETKAYMQLIKKSWNENKNRINLFLRKLLKIDFSITPIVYISHPNTYKGCSFADNKIAWGHFRGEEDLNYNFIYLVHEGLHCLLPYSETATPDEASILHAIIELIADYELYSFLKGESTFEEGHKELMEYKKRIYPYWLNYVGLDTREQKERLKMDKIDINLLSKKELKNMNILQLLDFCCNKLNNESVQKTTKLN